MVRMGWKWALAIIPYGDAWRDRRQMFMQYFHPGNTDHKATEMEFLRKMLPQLLKDPEGFLSITRQYVPQLPIDFNLKAYYCQYGWWDSHIACIWSRHQGD